MTRPVIKEPFDRIHGNGLEPDVEVMGGEVAIETAWDLKKDSFFKTALSLLGEKKNN